MGKQFSKAGARANARKQRPQALPEQQPRGLTQLGATLVATSRSIESDRTILTLKLQRDEFTMYKGRISTLVKKEQELLRKLLLAGKKESAKLILKKKKFQDYLLEGSEKELNSILNQVNDMEKLQEMKAEAEQLIEKNSDALKRIQVLLSLEHVEKILEDSQEGHGKHAEINQALLTAYSMGKEIKVEFDLDSELDSILTTARSPSPYARNRRGSVFEKKEKSSDDAALPTVIGEDEEEDQGKVEIIPDTEEILNEKLAESSGSSVVIKEADIEEAETGGIEAGIVEESGTPSANTLKKTDAVSSSLLPNVPSEPVDSEKPVTNILEAETA